MEVSGLFIYPVKSLGGVPIHSSNVSSRGLEYDRRWMLVDDNGMFLTQRQIPLMALFKVSLEQHYFLINFEGDTLALPLVWEQGEQTTVQVWSSRLKAVVAEERINDWFSRKLGISCKAVYMPAKARRKPHFFYTTSKNDLVSFADGFPILMISQASLDDLNGRLTEPVLMDRFRPNIVFTGGVAFVEDSMKEFAINGYKYYGVKLCGRCIITCTDQQTAAVGKEPLKTLATYRKKGNKINFGQNIIPAGAGFISIGNKIVLS